MGSNKPLYLIFLIIAVFKFVQGQTEVEKNLIEKLKKITKEPNAIDVLNNFIYNNPDLNLTSFDLLDITKEKNWLRASKLLIDFLMDLTQVTVQSEVEKTSDKITEYFSGLKSLLNKKKKNIIKISPIFEWSQDNHIVKIRLKFAKNLESPGEKDIQNFKVRCTRNRLEIQGYKEHEDYVVHYYRDIHLYDFIKTYSCQGYKETDGTYIIKFLKNQPTLYWNFLNQIPDDHSNMFTWFDVFTSYDNVAKYTEFRDWTKDNLLMSDIEDHIKNNTEDKLIRLKKIQSILNYLKTKGSENKNFCNCPVDTKHCLLPTIHDWNYWL